MKKEQKIFKLVGICMAMLLIITVFMPSCSAADLDESEWLDDMEKDIPPYSWEELDEMLPTPDLPKWLEEGHGDKFVLPLPEPGDGLLYDWLETFGDGWHKFWEYMTPFVEFMHRFRPRDPIDDFGRHKFDKAF